MIGYDYAIVHFGDGSDDHIASGFSDCAMNKSPSDCTPIHSNSDWDGSGFVTLLMTFVSKRWRVKGRTISPA